MKFNIPLPFDQIGTGDEFATMDSIRQVGGAIERAGFNAALVTDHPCPSGRWLDAGGHQAHDPFVMLSLIAAHTSKVRLQTGIVVLPYRNPFIVARAVASLDRLSGGRVTLGVGVGYMKGEYKALGADFETRADTMDEYIRAIKTALSDEEFAFEGTGYHAQGNRIQPMSVQKPHPPILVGGNAKRAIRRAVELGDGWNPFFTGGQVSSTSRTVEMRGADDLAVGIAYMRDYAAQIGRETPPFVVTGSLVSPGETCSDQEIIDRAGRFSELGVSASGLSVKGRTCAEWCDNAERAGAEILAKV